MITVPMILGTLIYAINNKRASRIIIAIAVIFLMADTASVVWRHMSGGVVVLPQGIDWDRLVELADTALSLYILYLAVRLKSAKIGILTVLQAAPLMYFEHGLKAKTGEALLLPDNLSSIMLMIVAVIGSLIMIFAIKYMDDDEEHKSVVVSRQPRFFAVIMLFLDAMDGLVMANNILWLYLFWEITTLCSFLLISHDGTEQAMSSGIRALIINMSGGVAFVLGIIAVYHATGSLYIQDIIKGTPSMILLLGIALLAIAAFTKAAQFPFQSWLLGAMVAPTPVSALLHSSTMVKAGVYLLIRLAPVFQGTLVSDIIGLYGAISFVAASLMAISQSNAKRILAYSTVANLGLIIASAGVNTPMAIAAAILLIIFHAVSKGLLFLSVGTIEHEIGSRDIEDMRGLFYRMPYTSAVALIGLVTMLLAPFGVLLSKWMILEAASKHPVVAMLMALGSALTAVYYTNWMGVLLDKNGQTLSPVEPQSWLIRLPLTFMALGAVILTSAIGLLVNSLVKPEVAFYYHNALIDVADGIITNPMGSFSIYPVLLLLVIAVLLAILSLKHSKGGSQPYACGLPADKYQQVLYKGDKVPLNVYKPGGYYFASLIKERGFTIAADITGLIVIAAMVGVVIL